MLLKENFSEEYIRSLQKDSKRDPVLLERTVYAFGLLEALARVRMPFIFKGGTCLFQLSDMYAFIWLVTTNLHTLWIIGWSTL